MRLSTSVLLAASILLSTGAQAQVNPDPRIAAAAEAATAWLVPFDAGNIEESWKQSAGLMRQTVPQAELQQRMVGANGIGPLQSRTLRGAGIDVNPANAPPGEYVVLQYLSSYAKRDKVIEKIYSIRESDGNWRVVNYLMQ